MGENFTREICDKLGSLIIAIECVRETDMRQARAIYAFLTGSPFDDYEEWVEKVTSKYEEGKDYKYETIDSEYHGTYDELILSSTLCCHMIIERTEELFRMALTRQQEKGDVDLEKVAYYRSQVYSEYKLTKL